MSFLTLFFQKHIETAEKVFVFCVIAAIFHKTYIPFKYVPYEKIILIFSIILSASYIIFYYFNKNRFFHLLFKRQWNLEETRNLIKQLFLKQETGLIKFFNIYIYSLFYFIFLTYAFIISYASGPLLASNFILLALMQFPLYALLGIFCSKHKKTIVSSIFILSSVYFILSIISLIYGNISWTSKTFQNIFLGQETTASMYQNINLYLGMFAIIIYCFIEGNKKEDGIKLLSNIFLFLILSLSVFFMAIIGGRSSFIFVLAIIFYRIFLLISQHRFLKSKYTKFTFLFIFCSIVLLFLFFLFFSFGKDLFIVKRLSVLFDFNADSSSRFWLWREALSLFTERPFLGSGLGAFPDFIGKGDDLFGKEGPLGWHPHNLILELLCELGIFGLCLFFLPNYFLYKKLNNNYANDFYSTILFSLLVYFFLIFMVSGGLPSIHTIVFLFFSFLFNSKNYLENSSSWTFNKGVS